MRSGRVWLGIAAVIALVLGGTLLPFFPGEHDSLAAPLSLICQVLGVAGLFAAPFGALWVATGSSSHLAGKQTIFAFLALVPLAGAWSLLCVGAFLSGNLVAGILGVSPAAFASSRVARGLKALKTAPARPVNAAAYYLLVVPPAVFLAQSALVPRAIEFSRTRVIENSAALIGDIERYRAAQGKYPPSLHSVWGDYKAGIIGVSTYQYEPNGNAYNLFFEQPALHFGTREFVMYNPLDEHRFTSHRMDLLRLGPEALALDQARGHYALHDAPQKHWKYYWFD